MSKRLEITTKNVSDYFLLEKLLPEKPLFLFKCTIEEYNDYLFQDAIRSLKDHISKTWLLCEHKTRKIAAYMSLIMDAIKLSASEKELHGLNYPFKTIPAMKIAKLAVDGEFLEKYKGIGSFMIKAALGIASDCNEDYCAARFLTVDADIEHDSGVLAFYEKNGFIPNAELFNKNRKTISMRKDIYK
ncbi:MAG: GNAT family N-acetyltransferase [Treponema sp.]|jgi:ribosomal protein S18 acetylase RimI-like enzyme|nr:GNAT family N-acetyltransferase [Treponema sp.]